MMKRRVGRILSSALVLLFLVGPAELGRAANIGLPNGQPGVFDNINYDGPVETRLMRVFVPPSYTPNRPIGIIWGFHGGGINGSDYTGYLLDLGIEDRADEEYWICVSLAKMEGGWGDGGHLDGNQHDSQLIVAFTNELKKLYAIDEQRYFATGFSSGGSLCLGLPRSLPNFFAATAPVVPYQMPGNAPAENAILSSIGFGGRLDGFPNAGFMLWLTQWYDNHDLDAEHYIGVMGHSLMPPDKSVTPPITWLDRMAEYFAMHPKNYKDQPPTPPKSKLITAMRDDFDTTAGALDASRWRTEAFDHYGTLYQSAAAPGVPAAEMFGYLLTPREGWLEAIRLGDGPQGAAATTRFARMPASWSCSFITENTTSSVQVCPFVLRDPSGRVLSLHVGASEWRWDLAPTHARFRNLDRAGQTLAAGSFAREVGVEYEARLIMDTRSLSWSILQGSTERAGGTLNLGGRAWDYGQFGLGLKGPDAGVRFGHAELVPGPNAARNWFALE